MNTDEPYFLYTDKRRWLRSLHKAMLLMLLPLFLGLFLLCKSLIASLAIPLPPHPKGVDLLIAIFVLVLSWLPWMVVSLWFFAYVAPIIRIKKQNKPIVVLTRHGISFDLGSMDISVIPWNEIAEVRMYRFVYQCIGFVPRDLTALRGLVDKKLAHFLWLHEIALRPYRICLRKCFAKDIFLTPLSISQNYISIPLDQLRDIIEAYRLAYVPLSPYGSAQEGVWPPPPNTMTAAR